MAGPLRVTRPMDKPPPVSLLPGPTPWSYMPVAPCSDAGMDQAYPRWIDP